MTAEHRHFIPAAGHDWLLPFYDPLQWLLGGESARRALLEQAALPDSGRVLDVGCGTGSLAVAIRQEHRGVEVIGLDPDPKALARAARKAEAAGVSVAFDTGYADALPYPDGSFARVFSSFMFHHLALDVKRGMLGESRRVLAPGGSLHLLDFAGREAASQGFLERLIHASDALANQSGGAIPALMKEAGFAEAEEITSRTTLFGRIGFFVARAC